MKRFRHFESTFYPLLSIALLSGGLEIGSKLGVIQEYVLPAPTSVFMTLIDDRRELATALAQTAKATVLGLGLSVIVGLGLGILSVLFRWIRLTLVPLAVFFQTVPIIAVAPLLVIWFGFGLPTVIASAFIVSVFPVISATTIGLRSVEPQYLDLFQVFRASRLQTLLRLRIPFALPHFMGGLRIASGLAVIGAIVGEFIGGGGIGEVVDMARTQQRLDKVFAAVVLSASLGWIFVVMIDAVSNGLLGSWYGSNHRERRTSSAAE